MRRRWEGGLVWVMTFTSGYEYNHPATILRTLGTVVAREIPVWRILKVVRSIRAGFRLQNDPIFCLLLSLSESTFSKVPIL